MVKGCVFELGCSANPGARIDIFDRARFLKFTVDDTVYNRVRWKATVGCSTILILATRSWLRARAWCPFARITPQSKEASESSRTRSLPIESEGWV